MSNEALEILALRGDLNFEHIVVLQIQRCLTTTHDYGLYSINVDHLLRMLPKAAKESKEFEDRLNKLTVTKEVEQYKYSCGHPIGTRENPVYRNNPDDWNYDPKLNDGKPILVSPKVVEEEVTDWQGIFELCLHTCDDLGISWKKQSKGGAR